MDTYHPTFLSEEKNLSLQRVGHFSQKWYKVYLKMKEAALLTRY